MAFIGSPAEPLLPRGRRTMREADLPNGSLSRSRSLPRPRGREDPPQDSVAETIRRMQASIDALEGQRANDRGWLENCARRIDQLELTDAQLRAEMAALDFKLRSELRDGWPGSSKPTRRR